MLFLVTLVAVVSIMRDYLATGYVCLALLASYQLYIIGGEVLRDSFHPIYLAIPGTLFLAYSVSSFYVYGAKKQK